MAKALTAMLAAIAATEPLGNDNLQNANPNENEEKVGAWLLLKPFQKES